MKLKDYLEALRACPDERLTAELGVYDNWPIFLRVDYEEALKYLRESGKYGFEKVVAGQSSGRNHHFDYVPGTVRLQVLNYFSGGASTGMGFNLTKIEREHSEKQKRDHNMTVILHPYQEKKIKGVHFLRAMVRVIDDIGQFAMRENIPLCFPDALGWDHLEDYSRIVYFPDCGE